MSFCLHVSALRLLDAFQGHLVLGVHTKSCWPNFFGAYLPIVTLILLEAQN